MVSLLLWLTTYTLLSQLAYAHGMSEVDKQAISDGGNLQFMWIGASHMLSGYDHLLFVFGIIFFLSSFRDIVKYVTAFTIGHSITLIYATFNGIQFNYYLIDAMIALSVCYIAFANLDGFRKFLNVNPPNMMMVIVGFGLIHGLGLSTRLQELPLSKDDLLLNIISFNIGIELGQVIALALMLALISLWRHLHAFITFSLITNYGLIVAGALLFLMQMHDYSHSNQPAALAATEVSTTLLSPLGESFTPQDSLTIIIPARGDLEYKVSIKKDEQISFSWSSDGPKLYFDFHGDPKGDTSGFFQSYETGTASQGSGLFTPPFEGKHGWYWKNSSNNPATVTLKIQGSYGLIPEMEKKVKSIEEPVDFMDILPAQD